LSCVPAFQESINCCAWWVELSGYQCPAHQCRIPSHMLFVAVCRPDGTCTCLAHPHPERHSCHSAGSLNTFSIRHTVCVHQSQKRLERFTVVQLVLAGIYLYHCINVDTRCNCIIMTSSSVVRRSCVSVTEVLTYDLAFASMVRYRYTMWIQLMPKSSRYSAHTWL